MATASSWRLPKRARMAMNIVQLVVKHSVWIHRTEGVFLAAGLSLLRATWLQAGRHADLEMARKGTGML